MPSRVTVILNEGNLWNPGPPGTLNRVPAHDGGVHWFLSCIDCGKEGALSSHDVQLHEDGTVTVSPSIQCPFDGCKAHYFIRRSEVQRA
jgi:hypothetical protein